MLRINEFCFMVFWSLQEFACPFHYITVLGWFLEGMDFVNILTGILMAFLTTDFSFSYNSLASIVFGATAVYPSPSFDAHASLMAVQDEK